jgi:hypothetical protein
VRCFPAVRFLVTDWTPAQPRSVLRFRASGPRTYHGRFFETNSKEDDERFPREKNYFQP